MVIRREWMRTRGKIMMVDEVLREVDGVQEVRNIGRLK